MIRNDHSRNPIARRLASAVLAAALAASLSPAPALADAATPSTQAAKAAALSTQSMSRISVKHSWFKVKAKDLERKDKDLKPKVTVTFGASEEWSDTLVAGVNYTLVVKDSKGKKVKRIKKAGTYKAIVKGKGRFKGKVVKKFKVKQLKRVKYYVEEPRTRTVTVVDEEAGYKKEPIVRYTEGLSINTPEVWVLRENPRRLYLEMKEAKLDPLWHGFDPYGQEVWRDYAWDGTVEYCDMPDDVFETVMTRINQNGHEIDAWLDIISHLAYPPNADIFCEKYDIPDDIKELVLDINAKSTCAGNYGNIYGYTFFGYQDVYHDAVTHTGEQTYYEKVAAYKWT